MLTRRTAVALLIELPGILVLSVPWVSSAQVNVKAPSDPSAKRFVTVGDTIEMTRIAGDPHYTLAASHFPLAYFSPSGQQFVVVLRKGNLKRNTNDYSLLLFHSAEAMRSPKPEIVATMSSSSNEDAIRNIRWMSENTIAFLGERENEAPQVYTVDVKTGSLEKRTDHASPVLAYHMSADGRDLIFVAEGKPSADQLQEEQQMAVPITTQTVMSILAGGLTRHFPAMEVFSKNGDLAEVNGRSRICPKTKRSPWVRLSRIGSW